MRTPLGVEPLDGERPMKRVLCHTGTAAALGFNMWISFRVLDDWFGLTAAIAGLVLFPLTAVVLPVAMFFFESSAAGPLSLWPGIFLIAGLQAVLNRRPKKSIS